VKSTPNYQFFNWARNQSCVAKNYFQPQTEDEIIQVIKEHSKIRVVGTGHSWNKICLTEDALVNFDNYNKVLHLDKQALKITVQAGIKLWQLNEYLDKEGLALKNLGSISEQSIAGAVSTGTHGTGINYQVLGSQIEEFSLIKADGEKITINREQDNELYQMALVNLGCLGIISEITLNIVPAFNLHDETYTANFEDVINNLNELVNKTDHFKLWWFPHTGEVVVYKYTRTQAPVNDSRFRQWFMDELISVNAYRLLLKIGSINRNWRKNINRRLVQNFIKPLDRVEKSFKVFNVPEPPLHRETEWAFDISDAQSLLREYKSMINTSGHRINFLQEIRFTKADDFALSPCYKRNTLWLGVYNADNFGWDELLADFEIIAKRYNGKPHWGKEFKSVNKEFFNRAYPMLSNFNLLRKEFDPGNKFANDFILKIFEA
jgi:L-gulonolactone oxidase